MIIMASIPVLFVLFILAVMNVLYLLLGIIVLLCGLIVLKQHKPQWFRRNSAGDIPDPVPTDTDDGFEHPKSQVYMVLSGCEDFGASRIAVNRSPYIIGRSSSSDYVIHGDKISRHHVQIEYSESENICYAMDMGSVNGTFLNSMRLTEGERYRLRQGDILMIDDRSFTVEYARY